MAEQTSKPGRWPDILTALVLSMTAIVAGWYVLIWFDPTLPVNPFPPEGGDPAQPAPVSALHVASNRPIQPTPTYPPTWTPTATGTATPTRLPSSTPRPTNTPTATSTPNPQRQYTIVGMRARRYPGSEVEIRGTYGETRDYTTYQVFYTSEGLRISGMMSVPKGKGPFPVIVLCHGYIPTDQYATGDGTWRQVYYLAEQGYIAIAPDYRSHSSSDDGASFYHIGYAQDVLNLISSLPTVDKADPGRVGLWGHSMGGGVALKAAVVSKSVDAVVVFGSVSADERVNYQNGMGNGPGAYGVNRLGAPDSNRLVYKRISPINYLDRSPPLSIHHGKADAIVPYQWSEDLFEAAIEQGATAELYLYPGAGHTFVDQDWQLAMERTLAFFDKHVKAGGR